MDRVDCVVVGAGVVGLACARRLAMAGLEVIVVERAEAIGTETSARNSEVIHAGIYYPAGSLKARFCIAGKQFLYRYCADRGIAHDRCGKLIVATDDGQLATLERIRTNAAGLGMPDLEPWTAARARELEPALRCTGALWSPTTGVIDSHGLMLAYLADAEAHGAMIAYHAPLERAAADSDGIVLEIGGTAPMLLRAGRVVNCAGLHAPALALRFEGRQRHASAHSLSVQGELLRPGRPLAVFPTDLSGPRSMPALASMSRSISRDAAGSGRTRSGSRRSTMWSTRRARRRSTPRSEVLAGASGRSPDPDYSGIRPKIAPAGSPTQDFRLVGPEGHGMAGLVELFGIESPGSPHPGRWPARLRACSACPSSPTTSPDRLRPDRHHELGRPLQKEAHAQHDEVEINRDSRQHGSCPTGDPPAG